MHTLQMMEALHTISSAQAYLSTPSETKISRSLILKEKEAYLARLHKSLQVLKQEMAVSESFHCEATNTVQTFLSFLD